MVEIEVANRSGAELDTAAAADLIRAVLHGEGVDAGELGLQLVGPDEIRALKREDFNNDAVDAGDVGSGHAVTAIY